VLLWSVGYGGTEDQAIKAIDYHKELRKEGCGQCKLTKIER